MNIGEAVKALQIKYPSASISRIRFLEKEGLINIKRSPGGTRKFTSKDMARKLNKILKTKLLMKLTLTKLWKKIYISMLRILTKLELFLNQAIILQITSTKV